MAEKTDTSYNSILVVTGWLTKILCNKPFQILINAFGHAKLFIALKSIGLPPN